MASGKCFARKNRYLTVSRPDVIPVQNTGLAVVVGRRILQLIGPNDCRGIDVRRTRNDFALGGTRVNV